MGDYQCKWGRHERHVAEPHATTSQLATSHQSRVSSNTGSEAIMEKNYHFPRMVVEHGRRDNDAGVNAYLPTSENYIRYLEGQQPQV